MKFANVKSIAIKVSIATFAAGALLFAGSPPAQAQQWGVGVQYGTPAYAQYSAPGYVVDRDDYYRDRDRHMFYERERARQEFFERQRREEFLRRQAYMRHEWWEHRDYDRDRDHDFRGYR